MLVNRLIDWHQDPSNLQNAFTYIVSELHNDLWGKSVGVTFFYYQEIDVSWVCDLPKVILL